MAEANESDSPKPSSSSSSALCEECGVNPSKYCCPGCSFRSCSLPCVKAHKQKTGCDGKRNRTPFVPLSEFDDAQLVSDYNLLEEVTRVTKSARKLHKDLCGSKRIGLPVRAKNLKRAADYRGTRVLIHPVGMVNGKKNRSYYCQRKRAICWTVEWSFHSTDVIFTDQEVNEHQNLRHIIENHLTPDNSLSPKMWGQLWPFYETPLDKLKFFLQKIVKGKEPEFRELNINGNLRNQLSGVVLLEFPVIHVVLPSDSYKFQVENRHDSVRKKSKNAQTPVKLPCQTGTEPVKKAKLNVENRAGKGLASIPQISDGVRMPDKSRRLKRKRSVFKKAKAKVEKQADMRSDHPTEHSNSESVGNMLSSTSELRISSPLQDMKLEPAMDILGMHDADIVGVPHDESCDIFSNDFHEMGFGGDVEFSLDEVMGLLEGDRNGGVSNECRFFSNEASDGTAIVHDTPFFDPNRLAGNEPSYLGVMGDYDLEEGEIAGI